MPLYRLLVAVAEGSRRRYRLVLAAAAALAVLGCLIAALRLGVDTNTDTLFSASLPWRQHEIALDAAFPQFNNLLVAVVDAATPEQADETASQLAQALGKDRAHIESVSQPDASPYLSANGLLFLGRKPLQSLLNRTIDAQPFLGQLVADPSARGLFAALTLVAVGVERGQADLASVSQALTTFGNNLAAAASGHPRPLSWENLLTGDLASQAGQFRFVLVKPKLDYGALEPGGAATAAIRTAAASLPWVKAGQAQVRITGSVALADEQFATVAQGALLGIVVTLMLVTLWLTLAVRSWRLVVPILLTLGLGLVLTTAFAAIFVGTLNLVSVAFAILFVGIAVDFSIQFGVRFREFHLLTPDFAHALRRTAKGVGRQILLAAAATACGFLAFVPTPFAGVAELGLIAGVGMLIAFACTIGFLPAAMTLCRPGPEARAVGFAIGVRAERALWRAGPGVPAVFAALAVLGLALLPRLTFDADPLHTNNPNTEAMRTLELLKNAPVTSPFSIDVLAPDPAAADALAAKLGKLPLVDEAITFSSFVPTHQKAKLALIGDAASLLGPSLSPHPDSAPVTASQLRLAAGTAAKALEDAAAKAPADTELARIGATLSRLATAPDATLLAMNQALTAYLPLQLERLRTALAARPVTAADVPAALARDWRTPGGLTRVQVVPRATVRDSAMVRTFVAQVRSIAPDATGPAVVMVESARTIVGAFRSAALLALAAITIVLALVLRRVLDVVLVLTPLLLSTLLTVVAAVLLPLPLNFANIIALPLLLGVGVSFNIYFVMNWRVGVKGFLGTATARATLFSALTTGTAFGSLALSAHPGTASMGELLLISLGCTLVSSFVFIPALLHQLRPPKR